MIKIRATPGLTDVYFLVATANIAVTVTEGSGLSAGWYSVADSDLLSGGLTEGTWSGAFLRGTFGSPSASDPELGIVPEFRFTATGTSIGTSISEIVAQQLTAQLGCNNYFEVATGSAYATIAAAQTAAQSGDLVIVGAGSYNVGSIGKNGVTYWFRKGAVVTAPSSTTVFDGTKTDFRVLGNGQFVAASNAGLYISTASSVAVQLEGDSFDCSAGANTAFSVQNSSSVLRVRARKVTTNTGTVFDVSVSGTIHADVQYISTSGTLANLATSGKIIVDANDVRLAATTPVGGSSGTLVLRGSFACSNVSSNGINSPTGITVICRNGDVLVPAGRPSISGSGSIMVSEAFVYDTVSATASNVVLTRGASTMARALVALPNAAPGGNLGLPTVNASNYVAGLVGTIHTLDALDTSQNAQHTTTLSRLPAALSGNGLMMSDMVNVQADDSHEAIANDCATALFTNISNIAMGILNTLESALVVNNSIGKNLAASNAIMAKLLTAIESDGGVWRFTSNALELAPITTDVVANFNTMTLLYGPNLTAVDYAGRTGMTDLKAVLIDKNNKVFNTSTNSFDTLLDSINWATSIRTMSEVPGALATGMAMYRSSVPSQVPIGTYTVIVQDGTDASAQRLVTEMIFWDGQSVVPISGALNTTYAAIRSLNNLGSGSLSKILTIFSFSGKAVPTIPVWVTLDAAGAETVAGPMLTDDFGKVTFMLNPGSYYAWAEGLNTNVINPTVFSVP
jgi:hypothetical protein